MESIDRTPTLLLLVMTMLMIGSAESLIAELLLSPSDQVIGGRLTETEFVQGVDGTAAGVNNWPAAEPPEELIDGFYGGGNAKYLNFFEFDTGVIITPAAGATVVTSMTLWTANDAVDRDPVDYELYGTNVEIVKGAPGTSYEKSEFTLISEGPLALPADRNVTATPIGDPPFSSGFLQTVEIENSSSYTSYMLIFPNVLNPAAANSMQLSEAAFEGQIGTASPFVITEVDYDAAADTVTLTWRSEPGRFYVLFYSPDLSNWDIDIEDSIEAEADSDTTTYGPFPNPIGAKPEGYFRLEKAP